ncbi:Retinoblastoma-binding protein [Coemansia sp. Benny D115]|nr:Retinoblastoma-binding protein [Coemansia sp. Benny D115]
MSQIQYKFRSAKDYSSIILDGLSISVVDLKQEIMREQKLDAEEFDLVITNEQTNEDYKDDKALIPKNTMILVRRIPYTGPKISRVAVAGRNQQPQQQQQHQPGFQGGSYGGGGYYQRPYNGSGAYRPGAGQKDGAFVQDGAAADGSDLSALIGNDAEDAQIAAILQQNNDQWMHEQSLMEMQRPVYQGRTGNFRPRPHMMRPELQGPPPANYVCFRCGQAGHWIYNCPTIGQTGEGAGRHGHRIKRTTGIPKSFLQKVDINDVDNALVTSDGTLVVAAANEAAWNSAQRLARTGMAAAESIDSSQIPETLRCGLCNGLAREAVTTPCCKTVFCYACIEERLLAPGDAHFTCPRCQANVVPDQLEVADDVRGRVDEFQREYAARRTAAAESTEAPQPAAPSSTSQPPVSVATPPVNPTNANVVRPPAQMQPLPRPYGFPPLPGMGMGMMPPPGMMMGMPLPGMMPPGMVPPGMLPPPGMMPPGMVPPQVPPKQTSVSARSDAGSSASRDRRHREHSHDRSRDRSRDHSRRGRDDRERERERERERRSDSRSRRDPDHERSGRRDDKERERDRRDRRDDRDRRDHRDRRDEPRRKSRSPARSTGRTSRERRDEPRARNIMDRVRDDRPTTSATAAPSSSGSRQRSRRRR